MFSKIVLCLCLAVCFEFISAEDNHLFSDRYDKSIEFDKSRLNTTVLSNGLVVYIDEQLAQKIQEETIKWHFMPWHQPRTFIDDDVLRELDCIESAIESYPDSVFTPQQLEQGAFLLYVLMGIVAFATLAVVCNDYFIPCVELICEDLKIPPHIAAATFMASATSTPEFFVNLVSTLISESDMGIGTIVGSALFNCLGVASVGSLAAIVPIVIEERPVTRDCLIYLFNVGVLMIIIWDGVVDWYESTALMTLFFLYFIIMFNSHRAFQFYDWLEKKMCSKPKIQAPVQDKVNLGFDSSPEKETMPENGPNTENNDFIEKAIEVETQFPKSMLEYPNKQSCGSQFLWIFLWPLKLVLGCTVPSPITFRKLYPLSFILCIVWIGALSYLVSWSVAIIGSTFLIPDSVLGMTFLAFGSCIPEACSIYIMSRRGRGDIGVSNALGANSLAILFALGMPWFIKCMFALATGDNPQVIINSNGMDYIIGSIPFAVAGLWIVLKLTKFTLKKVTGAALIVLYLLIITYTILVELGILFIEVLPPC